MSIVCIQSRDAQRLGIVSGWEVHVNASWIRHYTSSGSLLLCMLIHIFDMLV